jgi:hypothetical protein
MKKFFLMLLLALASWEANAQNIQFHYDFGRRIYSAEEATRQNVTLTFEQFKPDALGSWYYFIDLDMYSDGMKGAYTEISREFTFAHPSERTNLAAHVEYNGGLTSFKQGGGTRFQNAVLVGPAWNGHTEQFTTTWSIQAMYKHYFKYQETSSYASFQLTGVWGTNFAHNRCTFSGFIDFWRGEKTNGHGKLVMMTEPQLWYNLTRHFSVGTEIEISSNFVNPEITTGKNTYVNPTLAVKYNF